MKLSERSARVNVFFSGDNKCYREKTKLNVLTFFPLRMVALAKKAFLQFIGFALFLLAGGLVFRAVENTGDKVKEEKEKALKSLETNMKSKYNMTARDFDEFAKAAHDALTPPPVEWTFGESTLFAMTVCTTIGESLAVVFLFRSPDVSHVVPFP